MDKNLEHVLEELINTPGVYGCVLADEHGLCLGNKGETSTTTAGIIGAIAEESLKLEPNSKPPIIHFENDNRSCTIQRIGTITGAIFKNLQN
ncbi:uncharacterized protein LOC130904024 [Diorhabda carinulata]|uniref:uncharacterized protein LOC130453427 n=1 Tax=Diorhabda sublineata TaxID=1163346 RepID=UPI0024E0BA44|nr:uncharacterized protein LOC130453427 [Diorhabda sublineata]XP_057672505.1 uncharacterized protein LOC130904024 [Diorhabda carinulata]